MQTLDHETYMCAIQEYIQQRFPEMNSERRAFDEDITHACNKQLLILRDTPENEIPSKISVDVDILPENMTAEKIGTDWGKLLFIRDLLADGWSVSGRKYANKYNFYCRKY